MASLCDTQDTTSEFSAASPSSRFSRGSILRLPLDVRVGRRFRMLEKLGAGAFGDIFRGVDVITKTPVAIKLEPAHAKTPQLIPEARLYKALSPDGPRGNPDLPSVGVPRIYWYGVEGDYHAMVMDVLGPSLEDLFQYCGRRFSVSTVAALAHQMLSRLEFMHSRHMVHRDVKPDNFLTGCGAHARLVHIIDLGLAKVYRDPKTLAHIPFRIKKGFLGTQRYASLNQHFGFEMSRRDDIEAVGYICIYFLRGFLPWQGMRSPDPQMGKKKEGSAEKENPRTAGDAQKSKARAYVVGSPTGKSRAKSKGMNTKAEAQEREIERRRMSMRSQLIGQKKLCVSLDELRGPHCPRQFTDIIEYAQGLRFTDKPDYDLLQDLIAEVGRDCGIDDLESHDWLAEVRQVAPRSPMIRSPTTPGGAAYRPARMGSTADAIAAARPTVDVSDCGFDVLCRPDGGTPASEQPAHPGGLLPMPRGAAGRDASAGEFSPAD
eukprot:TRINITY_DN5349_c0_g3_i1.p1 TRINITY_DN5349_c0_g3~~TRINITY_DN5349_c0_g3_i1.p1  ORF type:complete len:489 (+),score=94.12 TRINITY_DN5349_c0_g3_i1:236-1702(+)